MGNVDQAWLFRVLRSAALGGGLLLLSTLTPSYVIANQPSLLRSNRLKLPIPEPKPQKVYEVLPANVPMPKLWEVKAPLGAPNVVIMLLDDVGFAASSAFGGIVNMPTAERLADSGLRYNKCWKNDKRSSSDKLMYRGKLIEVSLK